MVAGRLVIRFWAILLLSLTIVSCNRDNCKNVVCANNGICNSGSCICPSGYEGANCETLSSEKFTGNWTIFEKGTHSGAAQYPVSVRATDNINNVAIFNFNNYFTRPILGVVYGNTITIPNQEYQGKTVFGNGYFTSSLTYNQYGTISLKYEVVDSATGAIDDYGYYQPDLSNPSAWNK